MFGIISAKLQWYITWSFPYILEYTLPVPSHKIENEGLMTVTWHGLALWYSGIKISTQLADQLQGPFIALEI